MSLAMLVWFGEVMSRAHTWCEPEPHNSTESINPQNEDASANIFVSLTAGNPSWFNHIDISLVFKRHANNKIRQNTFCAQDSFCFSRCRIHKLMIDTILLIKLLAYHHAKNDK